MSIIDRAAVVRAPLPASLAPARVVQLTSLAATAPDAETVCCASTTSSSSGRARHSI